jgi:hypothetical protein
MIGNIKIERDLDLDFDLNHVKSCIEKIIPIGVYTLHSKNDIFHTFRLGKMDGLEIVSFNVTLKKIDEQKCNIKIDCIENIRNSGHESVVNRILDNFLERLSKSLIGLTDEQIKEVSNKGCMGVLFFLLLPLGLLLHYLI